MTNKSCLCVIPARGGSKGVPFKNIVEIGGRPLISYSTALALEAKRAGLIDDAIVSTDDERIAEIARQDGIDIPFIRPAEIASDSAKSVDVVIHALNHFEERGAFYDMVLLLQPTTPLRTLEDVEAALAIMDKHQGNSLISCYCEEYICDLVSYHRDGEWAIPLSPDHNAGQRRQEQAPLYVRNGALYLTKTECIRKTHSLVADRPLMYVMPKNRSVNVDTKEDLRYLEWIIQSWE